MFEYYPLIIEAAIEFKEVSKSLISEHKGKFLMFMNFLGVDTVEPLKPKVSKQFRLVIINERALCVKES